MAHFIREKAPERMDLKTVQSRCKFALPPASLAEKAHIKNQPCADVVQRGEFEKSVEGICFAAILVWFWSWLAPVQLSSRLAGKLINPAS